MEELGETTSLATTTSSTDVYGRAMGFGEVRASSGRNVEPSFRRSRKETGRNIDRTQRKEEEMRRDLAQYDSDSHLD